MCQPERGNEWISFIFSDENIIGTFLDRSNVKQTVLYDFVTTRSIRMIIFSLPVSQTDEYFLLVSDRSFLQLDIIFFLVFRWMPTIGPAFAYLQLILKSNMLLSMTGVIFRNGSSFHKSVADYWFQRVATWSIRMRQAHQTDVAKELLLNIENNFTRVANPSSTVTMKQSLYVTRHQFFVCFEVLQSW